MAKDEDSAGIAGKEQAAREVGGVLQERRLALGKDLNQAASYLWHPRHQLEALERGDLGSLPLPLRMVTLTRYAGHLGLDGERLADPLRAMEGRNDPAYRDVGERGRASRFVAAAAALLLAADVLGGHRMPLKGLGDGAAILLSTAPAAPVSLLVEMLLQMLARMAGS